MDISEWIKQKLSALGIEDKFFIGALIIVGILLFSLVSRFQHIPSPIYGGDYYMARGFTQAILQGTPFWQDPYFEGNYAYYGWFSYLVTAFLVRISGIGLEKMSVILPAVIQLFYLLACYLFGSAFFKSRKYGLLFSFAALSARIIDMKISGAMATTFMMFAFYCFIKYEQGSKSHKYWLGLFMGLTALTHINIFIGMFALLAFTVLAEFIVKLSSKSAAKKEGGKIFLGTLKKYYLPFLIALVLSLALVGPWLFVYHMKTLNPSQQYSIQDISTIGPGWVLQTIFSFFIRTSGTGLSFVLSLCYGIILLLGLVFALLNRKSQEPRYALFWLFGVILLISHFLITKPLLNNWIAPGHLWGATSWLIELVLFVFGIKNLELMFRRKDTSSSTSSSSTISSRGADGAGKNTVIAAAVFLLFLIALQNVNGFNNDTWVNYGRSMDQSTTVLFEIEDWILASTPEDSVFLANDESSFALNALTGRRLVIARRTHANYYVDVEQRYADAMVMLYGNNKSKTIELLNQYNVTYLYMDSFLVQYSMIATLRFEDYLSQNGITSTIETVRLDPSTTTAPSYLSLVVPPQEFTIMNYNLTSPIKQFMYSSDQPYAILFEIEKGSSVSG